MRLFMMAVTALLVMVSPGMANDHLIVKKSPHSVAVTLDRLTAVLESKGVTVFARIDHAAGAEKTGQKLRPTQVLVFGNPKLGTPLMIADQRIAVDLPLKALAWQDASGAVWLGYTNPEALKDRFAIKGRDEVFKKMAGALDKLTGAALKTQ